MGLNINIDLWLQDELIAHAEKMFRRDVNPNSYPSVKPSFGFLDVTCYAKGFPQSKTYTIKEVLKDYINSEDD